MFPEPVTSIVTFAVLLLGCVAGVVFAVRRAVRALRLRNAPPSGLLRAGAPTGATDPVVAADRAEGRLSWMRIGGGL